MSSVSNRDKAAQLLVHYISLCMMKAGLKPDGDTEAELNQCVDLIIDAAVEKAAETLQEEHGYVTQESLDEQNFLTANDLSDLVKSNALL